MARMLRSTTLLGAVALAAVVALTGCATNGGSAGSDGDQHGDPGHSDPANGPAGIWGDPDTSTEPSLELVDDGTLTGTDGCNRLRGGWTEEDDRVSFGQVASTRMACEGVDTWLSSLDSATVDGDTMTVFDASGSEIGTLERAE